MGHTGDDLVHALQWLARLRAPSELIGSEADELAESLGLTSAAPNQILTAIDEVIEALPGDEYGHAAKWLLGTTEYRWGPLAARRSEAARAWQMTADGFRRERADGGSRELDTYRYLAAAITDSGRNRPAPGSGLERPSRRWLAIAGAAVIGLVAVGAAIVSNDGGPEQATASAPPSTETATTPPPTTSTTTTTTTAAPTTSTSTAVAAPTAGGCAWSAGDHDAGDPVTVTASELIQAEHRRLEGSVPACAAASVSVLGAGPMVSQAFGEPDQTPTIVIATDGDRTLAMPFAAWGSYAQIGGRDGLQAFAVAGAPVGLTETSDAAFVLLDSDVQLVAEEREAPYYFVLDVVNTKWEELGGIDGQLGLPRSNPYVIESGFRQDFDGGYLLLSTATPGIDFVPVDDPIESLPALDSITDRLVRHDDGTSWFVTVDGMRKWIPDGPTWSCLERGEGFAAESVPGYAIATLPYAGVASCDDV